MRPKAAASVAPLIADCACAADTFTGRLVCTGVTPAPMVAATCTMFCEPMAVLEGTLMVTGTI